MTSVLYIVECLLSNSENSPTLGGSKQEIKANRVKGLMTARHSLWFRRRISQRTFVSPSITVAGVVSPHSFSGFLILSVLSTRGASSQEPRVAILFLTI